MNEQALHTLFRSLLLAAGATSLVGCAGYHYIPASDLAQIRPIPPALAEKVRAAGDGELDEATCREICGAPSAGSERELQVCHAATLRGPSSEEKVVACRYHEPGKTVPSNEPAGRAPEGLSARPEDPSEPPLGRFFAEVAYLEEASITAFRRLERELRAHGAPDALVRAARSSMQDEARHTRIARRLARRFGGRPVRPQTGEMAVRPLAEIARENLIEGVLGETFGALVNHHQADRAQDPGVRDAYRAIAPDETRHASLALAVHAWLAPRLSRSERASLEAEHDLTLARWLAGARERSRPLIETAGLPDRPEAQRLLRDLAAALRPCLA